MSKQLDWYYRNRESVLKKRSAYQKSNRKLFSERKRAYIRKVRIECLIHYSGGQPKCDCCGETHIEFLAIDHINGGGAEHRRQTKNRNIYAWLQKEKYPDGFRVLCHNCNQAIGFYGYCPHKEDYDEA